MYSKNKKKINNNKTKRNKTNNDKKDARLQIEGPQAKAAEMVGENAGTPR